MTYEYKVEPNAAKKDKNLTLSMVMPSDSSSLQEDATLTSMPALGILFVLEAVSLSLENGVYSLCF